MFKAKVFLYKKHNWKEEKVVKKFDNENDYNKYMNRNPELKKMQDDFELINFSKSFKEIKIFLKDSCKNIFWKYKKRNWFIHKLKSNFKKNLKKSIKLFKK